MSEQVFCEVTKRRHTKPYERVTVRATISSLGNQDPAFHITLDTEYGRGGWQVRVCGCQHDEVRRWFPELTQYVKWHGFRVNRGVWYYVENAAYWAGFSSYKPRADEPAFENFKSTINWGCAPSDAAIDLESWWETRTYGELVALLTDRLTELFTAFDAAMTELFGDAYDEVTRFRIGDNVAIEVDGQTVKGWVYRYVVNGNRDRHFVILYDRYLSGSKSPYGGNYNPEDMTISRISKKSV